MTDSPNVNVTAEHWTENATLRIAGVPIQATFAEAFDMKVTRLIMTAADRRWCNDAAAAMVGFGTSVIACGVEIAVERELTPEQTPDGRPGVAILAFAVSGKELEKQIPRRAGQCVLTCPTTALYAGLDGDRSIYPNRVPIGKALRYFGDGMQISKQVLQTNADGRVEAIRYWRIPVMDGEFVCQHDVGRTEAIGGGNFILLGRSMPAVSNACRAAVDAIRQMPGVITPFPGGATRSGSKVGSKYATLFASTNEAFCPSLRKIAETELPDDAAAVLEVVLDGMSFDEISDAMKAGITAACESVGREGLVGVTAGNYGGKLGRHHFKLHDIMMERSS
ncbi:formylmethanofuran--tetrahydromethanopterin N-formyltransferase [Aporhodopirellula aestuarii]|uniref:Formylmethanofuran--tetrahydromethanopterin formyltransferase n=1 Tax=Aporhodopirellula aestuarii TaxID=2950107 RepID=A0ABT0U8E9_9BACT|nr:formylmethanofuran--tetrahydromethanopterin N-formyltransferase [Aporhodopirellula aestuarii]MCM2373249.1 formylmethanofuran--tetrahydromethanopterin N-formyltransferase [Aporhodopirellula aestuarii]